ncbi:hypothetical protein DFA_00083 [Cavenderia fasciculata]|uniref:ubiquitinyl hydrolase 1 n=1 Tax=Cavenderia fasciculata TaxID=261658 RepID=F4PXJ5_CACFS|nr:uncharacterized protein DFA_00083 [Cavenderia fasciculata]EGG19505.1 hypothetical protein DFA_00083 [Cavenderia fasciculata]|eukprot:XP_004357799.1 hypothetical protein DFA_00083 [Cavenderia fasciculata]
MAQEHKNALSLVEKLDKHQTRILVYRGLFSYEALLHSLSKTWSKHYGIRSKESSSFKRDSTLLAVPYRAKDTPSERAEYGHPDFVIILTYLSYYNQGLTFNQFQKTLDCIISSNKHDASDIYRSWTDYDQSIEEKYRDFSNFPSKLFANPWDLVYPKSNSKNNISCGFSGALMIGKTNEDVVKRWLELESTTRIDGALFFENDKLTTIDREGKKFLFSQSPLSDRLDRVLVYLDDYHTRGVDIKLPINSNAIVTVGNKITKEKLLQALSFPETLSLFDMYSSLYRKEKGDVVVSSMVSKLEKTFNKDVGDESIVVALDPQHSKQANLIGHYAKDKMKDQIIYSNMVEEEQEREFDIEAEVEIQRQLPPQVTPYKEIIYEGWRDILIGSTCIQNCPSIFQPIKEIFKDTLVWKCLEIQQDCFSSTLWATQNFTKTIINQYNTIKNIDELYFGFSMKEANHLIHMFDQLVCQKVIIVASLHQTIQRDRPNQREYFNKASTLLPSTFNYQSTHPLLNQINVLNGSKYFDHLPEIYQFLGIFRCESKTIMSKLINNDFIDQFGFVLEGVKPSHIDKLSIDDTLSNQLLSIIKTRRFKKCPIDLLEKNFQLQRIYSIGYSHIEKIINNK